MLNENTCKKVKSHAFLKEEEKKNTEILTLGFLNLAKVNGAKMHRCSKVLDQMARSVHNAPRHPYHGTQQKNREKNDSCFTKLKGSFRQRVKKRIKKDFLF